MAKSRIFYITAPTTVTSYYGLSNLFENCLTKSLNPLYLALPTKYNEKSYIFGINTLRAFKNGVALVM